MEFLRKGSCYLILAYSTQLLAHPYFNSSELMCNGSDPNVLMCDDFEDGAWYAEDCDTANRNGGIGLRTKGWCGSIYANPITPAKATSCGTGVTPFGNCAASGGQLTSSSGGRNMALHHFKVGSCGTTGSELCGVNEVYVRWYAKWSSGFMFGAEKHMNITNSDGDIAFGNVQLNCGAGSNQSTATPYIQIIHGEDTCQPPNISSISLQSGHWYFFEMHLIANATNGLVELWINDCGTSGTNCGSAPVLRTRMSGIKLPGNANGNMIQTIWLENWANPGSLGTGPYWDQVVVSRRGPIGFSGSIALPTPTMPAAPKNLKVF